MVCGLGCLNDCFRWIDLVYFIFNSVELLYLYCYVYCWLFLLLFYLGFLLFSLILLFAWFCLLTCGFVCVTWIVNFVAGLYVCCLFRFKIVSNSVVLILVCGW